MSIGRHAIQMLAELFGMESQYRDNSGRTHCASPEIARRMLMAKGIQTDESLLELDTQVIVVATKSIPQELSIYLEPSATQGTNSAPIGHVAVTETSGRLNKIVYSMNSPSVSVSDCEQSGLLSVSIPFPPVVGEGAYHFTVETTLWETTRHTKLLCVVCPDECYLPSEIRRGRKIAGVSLALYGVRSDRNWGVGDFTDLKGIIDWACEDLNTDFVGLNPLHALENKRPYNNSPYLPSSRIYKNYLYLDVTALEDFSESPRARALANLPATKKLVSRMRSEEHVNYEEASDLKRAVLYELFRTFLANHAQSHRHHHRWADFEAYRRSEGTFIERFATFCALQEHFQELLPLAVSWLQWPRDYHDPSSEAVMEFQRTHEERILFWIYVQWQISVQLKRVMEYAVSKGLLIGLYHDQALAVDRNGADCWAWQDLFHQGFSVGAPPDEFAPDGQNWGFPPPDRDQARRSGYEFFLKTLSANMQFGGALRIDHVMQLNHLFWIPDGKSPSDGVFVKDYESDLLNLLCLESQRHNTVIIGEDLGTVPPNFRERLIERGIFSYRLFYFERDAQENLFHASDYPERALVSISTHDLPTLAGFWSFRDIEVRFQIGQLDDSKADVLREHRTKHKAKIVERLVQDGFLAADVAHEAWESPLPTEALHAAVIKFILSTPSQLALVSQEDIFLDVQQQNFPGTTVEHPNWVTKMRFSVEELRNNPEASRFNAKFRELLEKTGRGRCSD